MLDFNHELRKQINFLNIITCVRKLTTDTSKHYGLDKLIKLTATLINLLNLINHGDIHLYGYIHLYCNHYFLQQISLKNHMGENAVIKFLPTLGKQDYEIEEKKTMNPNDLHRMFQQPAPRVQTTSQTHLPKKQGHQILLRTHCP